VPTIRITLPIGDFDQGMLALQELYSLWGSVRNLSEMPDASSAVGTRHFPHRLIFIEIKNTHFRAIKALKTRVTRLNVLAFGLAGSPKVQDQRGIKLRSSLGLP
jgi:hypothetical protein